MLDNPRRPRVLHTLGEHEVTRENGLITKVRGRPVHEYLAGVTDRRMAEIRQLIREGRASSAELGRVYGVGIDLRTGQVMEAVNGQPGHYTPIQNMHPLLRDRINETRGRYPNYDNNGARIPVNRSDRRPPWLPYPHFERNPTRHAEIKIVNEMLERRGPGAGSATMSEFRMDVRFVDHPPHDNAAPFCATCHTLLQGTPSNSGRNTHIPGHPDKVTLPE